MPGFTLNTPVALLVYNRPETTARVFAAIREARPEHLLVVADGPRSNRSDDFMKCAEVRRIVELIDWPCKVVRNYSETNLGCKKRVSSGLDWVFKQVEEAIILEDDCLPDPTFFRFCQEMLEKYRYNTGVASISGTNYQFGRLNISYSYYFSLYNHIWGWASWRRAWIDYDVNMSRWPIVRDTSWLTNIFLNKKDVNFWRRSFDKVFNGQLDTWDLQWTFACWLNNRLSVVPSVNLVSNIGFGQDASHTKDVNSCLSIMPVAAMEFSLKHPPSVMQNVEADARTQHNVFRQDVLKNFISAVKYMIRGFK